MAQATANQTPDRINMSIGLGSKTGFFVLGGGLIVFMLTTYLLRRYGK